MHVKPIWFWFYALGFTTSFFQKVCKGYLEPKWAQSWCDGINKDSHLTTSYSLTTVEIILQNVVLILNGSSTLVLGVQLQSEFSEIIPAYHSLVCRAHKPASLWMKLKPKLHSGTGGAPTTSGHAVYRTRLKLVQHKISWSTHLGL